MTASAVALGGRAERLLWQLAETLPQLVFVTDAEGACLFANRRWKEHTGLTEDGTSAHRWLSAVDAQDRSRALSAWTEAQRAAAPFERDLRIRGTWFRLRIEPFVDRGDVLWIASASNVDHEKSEMLAAKARFDVAANALGESLTVLTAKRDARGRIEDFLFAYLNPNACLPTGQRPEELRGTSLIEVNPHVIPTGLFDAYSRVVETGEPLVREMFLPSAGPGAERWLSIRAYKLDDGLVATWLDITHAKREAAELRDSEERFRLFLEMVPGGVAVFDRAMKLLAASRRYLDMIGLDASAIGRSIYETAPDIPEEWRALHRRVLAGETVELEEALWVRATGEQRRYSAELRPWTNGAGEVLGLLLKTDDVTERHAAAEALKESETRLQRVLMATPFPLAVHCEDGEIVTMNGAWLDGLGYAASELRTTAEWLERTFGRDRDRALDASIARLYDLDTVSTGTELTIRTKRGEERIWVCRSAPLGRDARGRRQVVTMADDVTDRRRAELEARAAGERLDAALTASGTGTFRWEVATARLEWDVNLRKLFALRDDEQIRALEDFLVRVHPDDRARVAELCERCAREGGPFSMEFRVPLPDGTERWIDDRGTMHLDPEGRPAYMTGACLDVTEQKLAHAALADEARRKDEFLAVLAHELRNPLAPIRYAADLLRSLEQSDPMLTRPREVLERQTRHMSRLVDDLLDVSRIARGKLVLQREPLDLRTIVAQCAADYAGDVEVAELTLRTAMPNAPVWVSGDPTRLAQALANLLRNACKFTNAGGQVAIELTVEGSEAVLRVSDSGVGIERSILPRLFQPFTQVPSTMGRSVGGLGLGLALVRGITELHEGAVTAQSEGLGRGTTVTMRLPVDARGAVVPVATPARIEASRASERPKRVVLVEDYEDGLEMMTAMLEIAGFDVVGQAREGLSGLEIIRRERPDGVLCDIGLPGELDGYEIARAIRADPSLAGVRLVALTGFGQDSDRKRAKAAGFDDHVVKPMDFAKLAGLFDTPEGDA